MKKIGSLLLILCFFTGVAFAEDPNQALFDKVNEAINEAAAAGESHPKVQKEAYAKAAALYTQIIDNGVNNNKIYYNLGNCYFQMGEYPKAILNYRRALIYMPADKECESNIAKAKRILRDEEPEKPNSGFIDKIVSFNTKIPLYAKEYFADISWVLFWGGLVGFFYLRKKASKKNFILIAVVWWLCLVSVSLLSYLASSNSDGIILTNEAIARKGDGESYEKAFLKPLKAGTEFTLLEERGDWVKVELTAGNKCWLKAADVGLVKDGAVEESQD